MAWWNDKKYYRYIMWALIIILGIYFVYLIRGIIFSFILAIVLAYLLNPVIQLMEQRGSPRVLAIIATYAALLIIVTSLILYGMPHLVSQMNKLVDVVPEYTSQVNAVIESIQKEYARAGIPGAIREVIEERVHWVEDSLVQMARTVTTSLMGIAGYIFNIILAPIFAFYILKDMEVFKEKVVSLFPGKWKEDLIELGTEVNSVINNFILGYALVSSIVGVLVWMAMWIIGVEFSFMLGVFAGLTNIIPYFGPVLGAVPALAIAILESKWLALKVLIAFFLIQQLESSLISPKILGERVGLHPLFVITVVLAGGQLFGLLGVLLAVPVSAVLKVVFSFIFRKYLIAG